jgi:hypothetical protein
MDFSPLLEAFSQIILSGGDAYLLKEFVDGLHNDLTRFSCTKVLDSSTSTEWRLMSVILSLPYVAGVNDYVSILAISLNMAAPIVTKSVEPEINQK